MYNILRQGMVIDCCIESGGIKHVNFILDLFLYLSAHFVDLVDIKRLASNQM